MEKIYKELTEEQRERGVCFSSCFSTQRTEQTNEGTIHEVLNTMTEQEQEERIKRLRNDKFFNNSSFKYNIIRT